MSPNLFEIVPHPRHPGDWLLKANERIPYGLWYRELRQAIGYAEFIGRDLENAEILVYKRDGTLQDRRMLKQSVPWPDEGLKAPRGGRGAMVQRRPA